MRGQAVSSSWVDIFRVLCCKYCFQVKVLIQRSCLKFRLLTSLVLTLGITLILVSSSSSSSSFGWILWYCRDTERFIWIFFISCIQAESKQDPKHWWWWIIRPVCFSQILNWINLIFNWNTQILFLWLIKSLLKCESMLKTLRSKISAKLVKHCTTCIRDVWNRLPFIFFCFKSGWVCAACGLKWTHLQILAPDCKLWSTNSAKTITLFLFYIF